MNRALSDPLSYYCMVNCHLLSYEICRYIEKRLTHFSDNEHKNFGVAFIYDEEAKDARIVALLDNYLIKQHSMCCKESLCQFVKRGLSVPSGVKSACQVDPDR